MKYVGSVEGRTRKGNWRYLEQLRKLSRDNRNQPTKAENLLWNMYLGKRPEGFKFLRQKPISRFVPDFYCSKLLLVVEVDGGSHNQKKNYDQARDLCFEQRGIKTIRYSNEQIIKSLNNTILTIKNQILIRVSELDLKTPLRQGERGPELVEGKGV